MKILQKSAILVTALLLLTAGCAAPPVKPPPEPEMPAPETAKPAPPVEKVLNAAQYLERGTSLVDSAQKMRDGGRGGTDFGWTAGSEEFGDYYKRAETDFQSILKRYPRSPQAAEAQYMLGVINDYPHMEKFEAALENYRLTMKKYPGTEAAKKAAERLKVIEKIKGNLSGTSHSSG